MMKVLAAALVAIVAMLAATAARADQRPGCLPTDPGTITWTLPTTPTGPSWTFTALGLDLAASASSIPPTPVSGQFQVTIWRRPCSATDSHVILTLKTLSGAPTFGVFSVFQGGASRPLDFITVNDPTAVSGNMLEVVVPAEVPSAISGVVDNGFLNEPTPFDPNAAFTLSFAPSWPYLNSNVANILDIPAYAGGSAPTGVNLNQQGLTGTWDNPATGGQGILIEVAPDFYGAGTGLLFAGWYTYDATSANGQRWYTLQGQVSSPSTIATIPIYLTQGGSFNAAGGTTTNAVGQATLTFSDCNHGVLTYTFTDGSRRSGTIPLTRLLPNSTCQ
jgi:hypothetical protein